MQSPRSLKAAGELNASPPRLKGVGTRSPRSLRSIVDPTAPSLAPHLGTTLPDLPPHAASPRGSATMSSFALAPLDAPGHWLHCGRGANLLPLPTRLAHAGQTPSALQLAGTLGCLRQLSGEILKLQSTHAPALKGLPSLCAVGAAAMGAEAAALLTAHQCSVGARSARPLLLARLASTPQLIAPPLPRAAASCLFEEDFDAAAKATMTAAPACGRAIPCLRHELKHAAERGLSLNLGPPPDASSGGVSRSPTTPVPPAVESGKVAVREAAGDERTGLVPPPSVRAVLVTPILDPATSTCVALLLCCNSRHGRFSLSDAMRSAAEAASPMASPVPGLRAVPLWPSRRGALLLTPGRLLSSLEARRGHCTSPRPPPKTPALPFPSTRSCWPRAWRCRPRACGGST